MKLSELIDHAVEAIEIFGDLQVQIIGIEKPHDISIVQYEIKPNHKRTVFAFVASDVEIVELPPGVTVQ